MRGGGKFKEEQFLVEIPWNGDFGHRLKLFWILMSFEIKSQYSFLLMS